MATTQKANGATNGKTKKKRPIFSRKYFPVQVAVFEYEHEGRMTHSVSLTRTFKRDDDSKWENTPYLGAADLLPAARLLEEAYSFIQNRLQRAYEEGHGNVDAFEDDDNVPY